MNKTLVVVPTYNERENLPPLAQRLLALPVPVDLLVVDDNSPDGTGKLADDLAAKHPSIHVLHRTEKSGLGRAYIAGFKWALEHGYEFVFELDGDFSHNPDDIPMFLEAAQERRPGAGLAVSERHPHHQLAAEPADAQQVRGELRAAHHRHADSPTPPAATSASAAARCRRSTSTKSTPTATASRSR